MVRHIRILLATALVIACGAGRPAAQAGLVTPDVIPLPVISSPIYGQSIAPGGLVANQYQGFGLLFPAHMVGQPDATNSTVVIQLNNRDVFAGAYQGTTPGGAFTNFSYNPSAGVTAALVLPGTTTSDVADSVTVTFESTGPTLGQVEAFDKNGRVLKTVTAQVGGVLDTPIELDVAGIQSVYATTIQPIIDLPPGWASVQGYRVDYWGLRSIEWHEAPEPAGFVLAGLGMFALLGYALRRRLTCVRLGVRTT